MNVVIKPVTRTFCEPLTLTRSLSECHLAGFTFGQIQRRSLQRLGLAVADDMDEKALVLPENVYPETLADGAVEGRAIVYPWDFLALQSLLLEELAGAESRIDGELSSRATVEGTLLLGKGSRVLPGVYIEGVVVIGQDCRIGPNAYIRGATSIGDHCHIGQAVEVKNAIIYPRTAMGHLSYCGDSIIGEGVNFGAGTILSNFRHDGKNHRSMVDGELVDTGRRKFGAVIGDGVHTGIHTSIYPGRKLWPGTSTLPGAIVQRDIVSETTPKNR